MRDSLEMAPETGKEIGFQTIAIKKTIATKDNTKMIKKVDLAYIDGKTAQFMRGSF